MTELERHLMACLERLEGDLSTEIANQKEEMTTLQNRVSQLEQYAPNLLHLCREFEHTLLELRKIQIK